MLYLQFTLPSAAEAFPYLVGVFEKDCLHSTRDNFPPGERHFDIGFRGRSCEVAASRWADVPVGVMTLDPLNQGTRMTR